MVRSTPLLPPSSIELTPVTTWRVLWVGEHCCSGFITLRKWFPTGSARPCLSSCLSPPCLPCLPGETAPGRWHNPRPLKHPANTGAQNHMLTSQRVLPLHHQLVWRGVSDETSILPGPEITSRRDPAPPLNDTLYPATALADARGVILFPTRPPSFQRLFKIPSAEPRAKREIVRKVNRKRNLHVGISAA